MEVMLVLKGSEDYEFIHVEVREKDKLCYDDNYIDNNNFFLFLNIIMIFLLCRIIKTFSSWPHLNSPNIDRMRLD